MPHGDLALMVQRRPVEPGHLNQARNQADGLTGRLPEHRFQSGACVDGAVEDSLGMATRAASAHVSSHLPIEPGREEAKVSQRGSVAWPVRRAPTDGAGLPHATDLT